MSADLSQEQQLALLPKEQQDEILAELDMDTLAYDWGYQGRPSQKLDLHEPWSLAAALAGRGFGKLLAVDTLVPTPAGWTTTGALKVGDIVFDEHGQPTKVLNTFDEYPERAWRLTFSDGTHLDAGGEHLWVTWTHQDRKQYLRKNRVPFFPEDWARKTAVNTDQLVASLRQSTKRQDLNHCIPTTDPLQTAYLDLPIDPYVLGYWLGDGSSGTGAVTIGDEDAAEVLPLLETRGYATAGLAARRIDARCATYLIGSRPESRNATTGRLQANGSLHSQLRALGVLGNKHVPEMYLRAALSQRRDLLAGLMDSDGTAGTNSHVEFCSTKEWLADAVLELARTLGQKPVKSKGRAMLNGVGHGPKYRVTWRPTLNPFLLSRKANRIKPLGAQGLRNRHRMITAAEPIPVQPMRCITVDSPNSMYLVGEGMIPTHNTLMGSQWIRQLDTNWAQLGRDQDHMRFCLLGRTAGDVRDVMLEGPSGIMNIWPPSVRDRVIWTPSRRRIELPNGSVGLCFSGEEPDQLRGPAFHIGWCDELAAFKQMRSIEGEATAWQNLRIGVRLGTQPQILATTTPKRVPVIKEILSEAADKPGQVLMRRGKTVDNKYLSDAYLDVLFSLYGGTALGRQELEGEVLDDVVGAMASENAINESRVTALPAGIPWIRLIGVDPSVAERPHDECGIVVVYISNTWPIERRHAFVVDDLSVRASPAAWGKILVKAAYEHQATIVAETNQGSNLVQQLIRMSADDAGLPIPVVRDAWSSKAKAVRSEPVGAAYSRGRVHHVNVHADLESQITSWVPGESGYSPDRMDALVHACAAGLFRRALVNGMPGSSAIRSSAREHLQLPREAQNYNRRDVRSGLFAAGAK